MALRLLDNPVHRRRRHSRRRNPGPAFPYAAGSTYANPSSRRKHHRRNPFGAEKLTQRAWGISPSEALGGLVGFVGTGVVAGFLKPMLAGLVPASASPGAGMVDIMYAITNSIPEGVSAAVIHFLGAEFFKGHGAVRSAVSIGAGTAVAAKFVASSHIAPQFLTDPGAAAPVVNPAGGAGLAGGRTMAQLPPPGASMGVQPAAGLVGSGTINPVSVPAN